jgi:hypothetical protein
MLLYIPEHHIKCHKPKTNMKACIIFLIFVFPFITPTQAQEQSLKCYRCSSEIGENCTADFPDGNEVNCQSDGACMITVMENSGQDDIIARDCVPEMFNEDLKCDSVFEGTTKISVCNCRDNLCNENWTTAGSTTSQSQDTTRKTTQHGPSLKCYSCTTEGGNTCDMSHFGEEMECPGESLCMISVFTETGKEDLFRRACASHDHGMEIKCDITETDTTSLEFCNCDHDLCNQDWVTAGSTTTLSSSTFDPSTTVENLGEKLNFNIAFVFVIAITLIISH